MKKIVNRSFVVVALSLMATLFVSGCKMVSHSLPPSGSVAGWDKTGDTRSFNPDTLWTYIDGGADQYVNAGVVHAYTADYKYQGNIEAVVDVYAMSSPAGAKKIFSADPTVGSKPVSLGDAARQYERSVVFMKGKNIVRITAYQGATNQSDALLALAQGVDSRL
jgi:hypothetical protein